MATPKLVADFETQLSTAIAAGATSFSISSATDDDGVSLPAGEYYFTIDNGQTNKEYLKGTLSGTSVTSVKSVSRQGVETSGAVRAHRVGASVIITDWATYKSYMDSIAIGGAANASTVTQGLVQIPSTSEVNTGASSGSTGAKLAVSTDALAASIYGLQLPSSSQKDFLNATTGMVSMYLGTSAPTGFLLCDGSAVSRTTYATLFALLSTTYGAGDGSTTFNVPDLRARFPLGYSSGAPTKVFTFSSRSSNTITVTSDVLTNSTTNELQTGQPIVYVTSGSVITGLTSSTTYYLIRVAYNQFSLATTQDNANSNIPITLSSDGSGTQTFTATYTARALGTKGGTEISGTVPAHTHTITNGNVQYSNSGVSGSGSTAFRAATLSVAGESAASNMPLFTVVNYIVKT